MIRFIPTHAFFVSNGPAPDLIARVDKFHFAELQTAVASSTLVTFGPVPVAVTRHAGG